MPKRRIVPAYSISAVQIKMEKNTMLAITVSLSQKIAPHVCQPPPEQKAFSYLSCPAVPDKVNYSTMEEL